VRRLGHKGAETGAVRGHDLTRRGTGNATFFVAALARAWRTGDAPPVAALAIAWRLAGADGNVCPPSGDGGYGKLSTVWRWRLRGKARQATILARELSTSYRWLPAAGRAVFLLDQTQRATDRELSKHRAASSSAAINIDLADRPAARPINWLTCWALGGRPRESGVGPAKVDCPRPRINNVSCRTWHKQRARATNGSPATCRFRLEPLA